MGIASLVFVILLAVAIAYLLWSFGMTWPLRSRELLIKAVNGRPQDTTLAPRWMMFGFAILALAIGVAALALADDASGGIWLTLLGALLAFAFLVRGIAGYTPQWRRTYPGEPFATLDRKTYSPAFLLVGAGFLTLVIMRLI